MQSIELPWPPASLSGHAKGNHQWRKVADTKKCRAWAHNATLAAKPAVPADGDITLTIRFEPPNRRGDRVNYPNRIKPYIDGIADALGVNDSRFLPSYQFGDIVTDGRVLFTLGGPL